MYDVNAQCEYHAGIAGHSIENCTTFKKLVERFIQMGIVKFDNAPSAKNLLPNHTGSEMEKAKRGLVISNLEGNCDEKGNYCEFHHKEGHVIQECKEFRALIQGLMDNKEIEFYEEAKEEGCICVSESIAKVPKVNYPMIIISRPKSEAGIQMAPKIIIQKPAVFFYRDNKRVSWNYDCNVAVPGKESSVSTLNEDQNIGSHTRSGKRYDLINAQTEPVKGKDLMVEQKKEKAVEPGVCVNEPVKEEEVKEFLKFLKYTLLLSSEVHRSVLMKVINETYVTDPVNKLDQLVDNISADNFIFFNDDEIPPGSMGSTKALHITTRCKGYTLLEVLIDNGRVMGRIEIPLLIGPTTYDVDFLVMDIKPSYNCLLGRPWIHSAGAVPSSLHQKLKLVSEGRLVMINAEEYIIVAVSNDAPYLETDDEAIEFSLWSL
ncbi:uncharacterized protein [Gossypium hirsutum]|uniref:Gag-pro-like protein n=1 Tax=Gossypium hirsutum TaxID=3635 RepID=A0A1U8MLV6_GOSHI|nr:uncharacterized protein LOC107939019 [Gossypium hirsutum]